MTAITFPGASEMAALARAHDWGRSPLGPVEEWPASLRSAVGVVLGSRFPMLLWWGPELIQIYNDAYRPVLGDKHPASLGASGRTVWAEIWDVVGPQAEQVLAGGGATWNEHLLLLMNRRGFVEETYFTFSYSPVPDDRGAIGGVLVTCQETTEQVQDDRQLRMLRDLAARAMDARTAEEACTTAAAIMRGNDADLPFTLLYLNDRDGSAAELVRSSGPAEDSAPWAPARVPLGAAAGGELWPLARALERQELIVVDQLADRAGPLPSGRWSTPPGRAVVLPLARAGQPPYGALIAGVSPKRALDHRYLGLFRLTADQIVTAIGNARAYEEARRRVEALAELDRARTAFFSNVSHEFRTPLTLMLGPTEEALESGGALAGSVLEMVHRNQLRLLRLVNALLDFARIEAGRMEAVFQPTDLAALTAELAGVFRSAVERAGIELRVDCRPLAEPVHVDRSMWEKVVLNLVSNAFKYTRQGAITVRLEGSGGSAVLSVSDTGVGIPEQELSRVFDRFHRIDSQWSRTHEGSGIGLAMVQDLVKLHGGLIRVTSAIDAGSTFTVELPFGRAHLPAERLAPAAAATASGALAAAFGNEAQSWLAEEQATAPAPTAAAAAARPLILVADDNADMRAYFHRLLRPHWNLELVADGRAALEAARKRLPDLVVADVMMPALDGFALLRELRRDPRTQRIPVVLVSARAGEESRVEGLEAGADDYLVKPFSARELVARVRANLELSRSRVELAEQARRVARVALAVSTATSAEEALARITDGARELMDASEADILLEQAEEAPPGPPSTPDSVSAVLVASDGSSLGVLRIAHKRSGRFTGTDRANLVQLAQLASATIEGQRLLRALSEADRRKDEFLALLGHELRNPLAPILTALELMKQRGAPEREREVIERHARHLTQLVDDLLDVARITQQKIRLAPLRIELGAAVARAVEMVTPLVDSRGHTLQIDVPTTGLPVLGDPDRLSQVFGNLLTNAARYTDPGGRIQVVGRRKHDMIEVAVRDSGQGIAPDQLEVIFEPFTQGGPANGDSHGLGLGLALVRKLVTLHGGQVRARSAGPRLGSEFTVELPAAAGAAEATGPLRSTPDRTARPSARILVVDDNVDAAELIAEVLRARGHQVVTAHDGPEALEAAGRLTPQVAVLDIGLPLMDGYELGARLRRLTKDGESLRLIALTGFGQERDQERSRTAGFVAHLLKPVGIEELTSAIDRAIG